MGRIRGFPSMGLRTPRVEVPKDRPLKLEIGFGKGASLLASAEADPGSHFLGIEAARSYYELVTYRARRAGLTNVQLVYGDGIKLVEQLAVGSVMKISVLFPDPWPKRRHIKRRIMNPTFISLAASRLHLQGGLVFKTDHRPYFIWALPFLDAEPRLKRALVSASPSRTERMAPPTHFERKYRREGRRIYGAWYVRSDRPQGTLSA